MKINKKFVKEVANGKYDSYDTHGEMKRAAQRILEEKVVSKFSAFCFRIFGGELPDNVMDMFDAFVDFSFHGAEIKIEVPENICPTGMLQVPGMTLEESLEEFWYTVCSNDSLYDFMCNREFKIAGEKGKFLFDPWTLHYYLDKRRLDKKDFLKMCHVA